MKDAIKIAIEALQANQKSWKTLADSGDAGNWKAEEQPVWRQTEDALSIMRGLEDAAPVCNHEWFQTGAMLSNEKRCIQCGEWGKLYTSPQAAQTEAALCEMVRLSEDAGLYDDFQTEAQERPAYTEGDVVGLCVCGSWSGGRCLRCEWRAGSKP